MSLLLVNSSSLLAVATIASSFVPIVVSARASEGDSSSTTPTDKHVESDKKVTQEEVCTTPCALYYTGVGVATVIAWSAILVGSYFAMTGKCGTDDNSEDAVTDDIKQMMTVDKILHSTGLTHDPEHPEAEGKGWSPLYVWFSLLAAVFTLAFIGIKIYERRSKTSSSRGGRYDPRRVQRGCPTDYELSDDDIDTEDDEMDYVHTESMYDGDDL